MYALPHYIEKTVEAIAQTASSQGLKAFLFKGMAAYMQTGRNIYQRDHVINIILSGDLDLPRFYESLIKYTTINREIESSPTRYYVVSNQFYLQFELDTDFDPYNFSKLHRYSRLTVDAIFYDLGTKEFFDPTGQGSGHLQADEPIIKTISASDQWDLGDVFNIALGLGVHPKSILHEDHVSALVDKSLSVLKIPIDMYQDDMIRDILLSNRPGKALQFIRDSFTDGKPWLFTKLADFLVSADIPINENAVISSVLNDKKIKLIDVYNEFFLFKKNSPETITEKKHRLSTTLRLLYDSPNLNIPTPYIEHVSIMNIDPEKEKMVRAMSHGSYECDYGECPECLPSQCAQEPGGSHCCCCDKTNYIVEAKTRCHKKIIISCNAEGTRPGPNDDPFPDNCLPCTEGCDMALERNGKACEDIWGGGGSAPPDWWNLPPDAAPCECSCREGFWSGGCEGCGTCQLTCVTCNAFCNSVVTEEPGACSFRLKVTPGSGCCGFNPIVDVTFVIDRTPSMEDNWDHVKQEVLGLVNEFEALNSTLRLGLVVFGKGDITPYTSVGATHILPLGREFQIPNGPLLSNIEYFRGSINCDIDVPSGRIDCQWDFDGDTRDEDQIDILATHIAATFAGDPSEAFGDDTNIIIVIGDEPSDTGGSGGPDIVQRTIDACLLQGITVHSVSDEPAPERDTLANLTGGLLFNINADYSPIIDAMRITTIPTSCDCLDFTPIYIKNANTGELDIPIKICVEDDLSDCDCSLPFPIDVCGNLVIVEPEKLNLVCCHILGCPCPTSPCDVEGCCGSPGYGTECPGVSVCDWPFVEAAIDGVWCNCFFDPDNVRINQGICTDCCCPDTTGPDCDCEECCNCCIKVPDGNCGFNEVCRSNVEEIVRQKWAACLVPPVPPPDWECENADCSRVDECIVGSPSAPLSEPRCGDVHLGCSTIRNPSITILNNAVGLVAYETMEDSSVIKIQQFHTSAVSKLLPNREFNHGRLENNSKWSGVLQIAKLYYYDEDLPVHFLSSIAAGGEPDIWKDAIGFKNGPLQNQCFPLFALEGEMPFGEDDIGSFVQFIVQGTGLSNEFPSGDDVYNIRWFIYDREDEGVIGGIPFADTIPGAEFLIESRDVVDEFLQLPPHVYNGEKVPVAFPSITALPNYMNHLENSQFVYLVYQALEDSKWNIYLRQIRLSEYEKEEQIEDANFTPLEDLGISEVVYRIVCTNDACEDFSTNFLLSRSITMEVVLIDGRDVYNNGFTGNWRSLCPGKPDTEFPKQKVFVTLTHSVVGDRCPDQLEFDSIFYNWQVGDEFPVPAIPLSAEVLFIVLSVVGDSATDLGDFDPVKKLGGVNISSSRVGAVWYDDIKNSDWVVLETGGFQQLSQYKGMDIDQPILLTANDTGHATRPVVKANYNNDVFVLYESTESDVQQIQIVGTDTPSSSLPNGVFKPRDIDGTLDYFYKPNDFVYRNVITQTSNKMNQLPDMLIDFNDVVHITWQSNRDNRWEIYYASSDQDFAHKRITNHAGRSLKSRIDGDEKGRLYIVWHDDRFGDWEIMMAYFDGNRVIPLAQQDPYLASVRNFTDGWKHSTGLVPLSLNNTTSIAKCFSEITVLFYEDRFLTNLAFKVPFSDWPFAFILEGAQDDNTTESFDKFTEWGTEVDDTNPSAGVIWTITSPEFDTSLAGSAVSSITPTIVPGPKGFIKIAFRASDTASDSNADAQWTAYATITLSGKTGYEVLDLPKVKGRYKQVRLQYVDDQVTYVESPLSFLIVESGIIARLCVGANSTHEAFLDLNPEVRVDKLGVEKIESPLPVGFLRNNTYFIAITAIDEDGSVFIFPEQKQSVSCESCTGNKANWDATSCSVGIHVLNTGEESRFYNVCVKFFTDFAKVNQIMQFEAFPDGNLDCFTVDENQSAETVWTDRGLRVPPKGSMNLLLWPLLSNVSGLLCGVKYWVEISICFVDDSKSNLPCDRTALAISSFRSWVCDCQSARWDPRFESAPVNIRDVVRWRSSGDGFSDTRLTETIGVSNLNPMIKVRGNLDGLIIYETNRESPENNIYKVYASVFSIFPSAKMYATGAEVITSPFDQVLVRSDVPIFEDGGLPSSISSLDGRGVSFDLDQYDNVFLASEVMLNQGKCEEFQRDKQQIVKVHRCGANPGDLFFGHEKTEEGEGECLPKEITSQFDSIVDDKIFNTIIKLVRIRNDFVRYHITRENKPAAVVDICSIVLQVIATQETVAIRLRNEDSSNWSTWEPFDPEAGEFSMEIPWILSAGSGLKTVDVQAATYQGLTASFTVTIIADYAKIGFDIKFYKLPPNSGVKPPDDLDVTDEDFFKTDNELSQSLGLPVAATRTPTFSVEDGLGIRTEDYILIEIFPEQSYINSFTKEQKDAGLANITFDFIQQGGDDHFGLKTQYVAVEEDERIAKEVFRGVITIKLDNRGASQDGLAFIIPHFKNDCSDRAAGVTATAFVKDKYNIVAQGVPNVGQATDTWASERDASGAIKHKITLRPLEDPYFVFGDPNYRLKEDKK